MWSFYWLGLWTEMRLCGLLAERQPTPAKVQAVSLHLTSAPRTWSRWAVIVDAGSWDCLHLYLKTHSDMLYNLECNIQVRHNHPYAWICKLFVFTCCLISAEWTRFITTELNPVYRTWLHKGFTSAVRTSSSQNSPPQKSKWWCFCFSSVLPKRDKEPVWISGMRREINDGTNDPCEHSFLHFELISTGSRIVFTKKSPFSPSGTGNARNEVFISALTVQQFLRRKLWWVFFFFTVAEFS